MRSSRSLALCSAGASRPLPPLAYDDEHPVCLSDAGQAVEEGARVLEPLHHDRATEARPQRLRVAIRRPAAPFHPRIPEPEGIRRTRIVL